MKRLLYQIHRWVGIALAVFMSLWFLSGLVIMYSDASALNRAEQLAHAQSLQPQSGWLSLGQAWERSAIQRQMLFDGKPATIIDARLVRQGAEARWLIEDSQGKRFALSAINGRLDGASVNDAASIARHWTGDERTDIRYIDTGAQDSAVRNHEALRPFHRFAVGSGGRELLVSARSGEVVVSDAWGHEPKVVAPAFYTSTRWTG